MVDMGREDLEPTMKQMTSAVFEDLLKEHGLTTVVASSGESRFHVVYLQVRGDLDPVRMARLISGLAEVEDVKQLDTEYIYGVTLWGDPSASATDLEPTPWDETSSKPTDLGELVASNVRVERSRRKWRQGDLADRLGWSRARVGFLESGSRQALVADLPQLCRAFDIPLLALVDGADQADIEALDL